jgi:hypothetical protein
MLIAEGREHAAAEEVTRRLGTPQHEKLTATIAAAIGAEWSATAVAARHRPRAETVTMPMAWLVAADGKPRISAEAQAVLDGEAARAAEAAGIELDRASEAGREATLGLFAAVAHQWSSGLMAWRMQLGANAWARWRLRPIITGATWQASAEMRATEYEALQDMAERWAQALATEELQSVQLGALVGAGGHEALARYAAACAMRTAMGAANPTLVGRPDERGIRRWRAAARNGLRAWQMQCGLAIAADAGGGSAAGRPPPRSHEPPAFEAAPGLPYSPTASPPGGDDEDRRRACPSLPPSPPGDDGVERCGVCGSAR